jgi:protoheme IX farnesyltransferase
MGWTAATGEISAPGLFLFGILFLWQLPHFTAISLYLEDDFSRAGIRSCSLVSGRASARNQLVVTLLALVAFSLAARSLGIAGIGYTVTAALIGTVWVAQAFRGNVRGVDETWARKMFGLSILYLPILITALVLDAS